MIQLEYKKNQISLVKKEWNSFSSIDVKLKSDRNFIIDCLNNGIDGRVLQFVNSYIFFKSYPLDFENISNFFDTLNVDCEKFCSGVNNTFSATQQDEILDLDFLEKIFGLTEHAFWAISENPSMIELLNYGTFLDSMNFEGIDLFWELAFKNPKFYFKYYNHYELNDKSWLEEYYGPTLLSTKNKILKDLDNFAFSIFEDYLYKEKKEDRIKIKNNFQEFLTSIYSDKIVQFYNKYKIDEFDIEISTNLKDFQQVLFNIKKDNL
jgi:hypothetical protein